MGLLNPLSWTRRNGRREAAAVGGPKLRFGSRRKALGIEKMEPRKLLAADVQVGAVYFETTNGVDDIGDEFQISFQSQIEGTQLTQIVIEGDKAGNGLTDGDPFFDTEPTGIGAFGAVGLTVVESTGFTVENVSLVDGSTRLVIDLSGFDAGEKLVFTVDVDEAGFLQPNSIAEGREFEGAQFQATFDGPLFEGVTTSGIFLDDYEGAGGFDPTALGLPPDAYDPNSPNALNDFTAGSYGEFDLITLAGTVYEDQDLDNVLDAGETGIAGVELTLYAWNGSDYSEVGTTTTDANGDYAFVGLAAGDYRVVETQPSGYFSVGAKTGTVNGVITGTVESRDALRDIVLDGSADSVDNDFSEALPAELHGTVYHDRDDDGQIDAGEEGIGGVSIRLDYQGPVGLFDPSLVSTPIFVTTASDGTWSAVGLLPGEYLVSEAQPDGWFDGKDAAGTAGGIANNPPPGDAIAGVFLTSGQVGEEYNFGELAPVGIRGRVHATGEDCVIDDESIPLAGVTVYLLDAEGLRIDETVTNANGEYSFSGMRPGVYGVEEVQPDGYYQAGEHVGSVGGANPAANFLTQIVLTSGQEGINYDFCEYEPASLAGFVYVDDNDDGVMQGTEPGIANVTLELLDGDGNATGVTTTTDGNGHYEFTNLAPGTYGVREFQPDGFFDGKDAAGSAGGAAENPGDRITGAVLTPGLAAVDYKFGELRPVGIRGRVHASDEDCTFDENSTPLAGVTMFLLDASGTRIAETTTDANGEYRFTDLAPGTYGVEEIQPEGYFQGDEHIGTAGGLNPADNFITQITLASGQLSFNNDFCEHEPASLEGFVYEDRNDDGSMAASEPGIGGVTLELLDENGNPTGATTTTDANGFYKFENLAPGTYGVRETQPDGYFDGKDSAGSAGGTAHNPGDVITGAVLTPGLAAVDYKFGELPPASLEGFVYVDLNDDGVMTSSEPGIAGVTVELLGGDGNPTGITTTTDAGGFYRFENLAPGTYGVREFQPDGYFDGQDSAGNAGGAAENPGDRITGAVLTPGLAAVDYKFGEIPPASLAGFVYVDLNDDGVMQGTEPGIAGVTVELLGGDGNPTGITTTTDAGGFYQFENLAPGTYGVREFQPNGYFDGQDSAGNAGGAAENPGDRITGAVLTPGLAAVDYKFGELPPASLAGFVYEDLNDDGVMTSSEPGIAGVTVELLDGDGNPTGITTTTDANGFYRFENLAPGTYGVREFQPDGYFDGKDSVGNAGGVAENPGDRLTGAVLAPGQAAVDYKFGELAPATISGYVFQDGEAILTEDGTITPEEVREQRDGKRTPDDTPIEGVRLTLGDVTGEPIRDADGQPITTVTDSRGYYEFTNLEPNRFYSVFESHPDDFVDGVDSQGTTGGIAINRGDAISPTLLAVEHDFDAIARVFVGPGEVSEENNFSEAQAVALPDTPILFPPQPTPPPPITSRGFPVPLGTPGPGRPTPPQFIPRVEFRGGGYPTEGYSWHLSVINDGHPRSVIASEGGVLQGVSSQFDVQNFSGFDMDRMRWQYDVNGDDQPEEAWFGIVDGIPVAGDWNGDGVTQIGVFRDGEWFLDLNGNGIWDAGDLWARLGSRGDQPVTGDWDGDGKTDIGIFGPSWPGDPRAVAAEPGLPEAENAVTGRKKNLPPLPEDATNGYRIMRRGSHGEIREDVVDHVFYYGSGGDIAVTGDWNGDGIATIGVYRNGRWILDTNGNGRFDDADEEVTMGSRGDLPVVGDFNGDGIDELGLFSHGLWQLDTDGDRTLEANDLVNELGTSGDLPVVGDFDGDGVDEPAVVHTVRGPDSTNAL